jgi:uncharacterized membrane protein YhhN
MKNKLVVQFRGAFVLLLAIHLFSIVFGLGGVRMITKSLLLPLLIVYLIMATGKSILENRFGKWAIAALLFSWWGDLLLMADGTFFFLVGMLSFMLTHISNSRLLFMLQSLRISIYTGMGFVFALLAVLGFYVALKDSLGSFQLPVVIYMVLISFSLVMAFNLMNQVDFRSTAVSFFIPGIGLFILSDAILAFNKFLFQSPATWDVWVMLTYGLAQWMITEGYRQVLRQPAAHLS